MKAWIIKLVTGFMATCRETSEASTDLAEGAVSDIQRKRIHRHLRVCSACRTYKAQMETGVRALQELPKEEVSDGEKDALLRRFRERRPQ